MDVGVGERWIPRKTWPGEIRVEGLMGAWNCWEILRRILEATKCVFRWWGRRVEKVEAKGVGS